MQLVQHIMNNISRKWFSIPIVEPDVLCDDEYDIDICAKKCEKVLLEVFKSLYILVYYLKVCFLNLI